MTAKTRRYPWLPTPRQAYARMNLDEKATLLDWIADLPQQTRTNMFALRRQFYDDTGILVLQEEMRGALDASGRKAIWGTRGREEPDYMAHRVGRGHGCGLWQKRAKDQEPRSE